MKNTIITAGISPKNVIANSTIPAFYACNINGKIKRDPDNINNKIGTIIHRRQVIFNLSPLNKSAVK